MKIILFHTLLLALSMVSKSQCTVEINAPFVAISNCSGPLISYSPTGTPPFTQIWSVTSPGFLSSTTSSTPNLSSTAPGIVIVNIIVIDGMGCTSTDIDTVTFISPTDTIYRDVCSYPDTLCPLPLTMLGSPTWTFIDSTGSTTLPNLSGGCVSLTQPGTYQMFGIYETACTVVHKYIITNPCIDSCSVYTGGNIMAISNCIGPQLSANGTGSGTLSYSWTGSSNVTFMNPTSNSTTVMASVPGNETVTVTLTDMVGCTDSASFIINFISPTQTFNHYTCTLPDSLCTLPIPIAFGPINWTFIDSIGTTPVGNTPCIAANQFGQYQLFTIYETNCTVIHTYNVIDSCGTTVNIAKNDINNTILIYPNPVSAQLNLQSNELINKILIFNTTGILVEKIEFKNKSSFTTIDTNNLPNGIFTLLVNGEHSYQSIKFIKNQ